jgi:hypothetical protein
MQAIRRSTAFIRTGRVEVKDQIQGCIRPGSGTQSQRMAWLSPCLSLFGRLRRRSVLARALLSLCTVEGVLLPFPLGGGTQMARGLMVATAWGLVFQMAGSSSV